MSDNALTPGDEPLATPAYSSEEAHELIMADMTALAMGWQPGQHRFAAMIATMFLSSMEKVWIDAPMSREFAGQPLHSAWFLKGHYDGRMLTERVAEGISATNRERVLGAVARHYFMGINRHFTATANMKCLASEYGQEIFHRQVDHENEVLWLGICSLSLAELPPRLPPREFEALQLEREAEEVLSEIYRYGQHRPFRPIVFPEVARAFTAVAAFLRFFSGDGKA